MNNRATYPLSHPQQRIWYTEKLYPGTSMWNNAGTLKIKGVMDYGLLRQAALIFIRDNPSLRLQVTEEDGRPLQYISERIPDSVDFIDLSGQGVQALYKWDSAQSLEGVGFVDSPLYYIAVIKLSDNEGCLFAKMHHLISDALSMVSFSGTVMKCYDMLLRGETPLSGAFTLGSYLDFVAEEERYMQSPRFKSDREYWMNRFGDLTEPTVIKPKPAGQGTRARRKTYILSDGMCGRIRNFCAQSRISEFTLFYCALAIYLQRTSGRKDIVINTPVYNRTNRTNKNAFGMFVSTVPLRMDIDEELSFTQFAADVSDMWFSSLKHQKYPYDVLLHELRKNGGISDAPSDITLSYQTAMFEKTSGLFTYEGRWHFSGHQAGALNIHLNDRDSGGRYIMDYDFLTPMFTLKEIEYIHLHLMTVIEDISANPDKPIYSVNLLTDEEKDRILIRFNDTAHPFPKGQTLPRVWRERVEQAPGDIAFICGDESYTYAEIDAMARSLAVRLRELGAGPERVVGVTMNRCAQVVAAELGILMAGGAFLPIDPELPLERAMYMLENSGAAMLVASPQLAGRFGGQGIPVITMEGNERGDTVPEDVNSASDLAYIIYTSGSTGKPKGVMIEHGMLLHYVYSASALLHYTKGYNTLCASSISFDISIMEIFCSLLNGGTLVMAMEHEVNIPSNMTALIKSADVNEMVLTPGRLELLMSDPGAQDCLKDFADIVMGGDVLPPTLLARLQRMTKAKLFNFYGPTEITIAATCKDVTSSREVNIGRPLKNVKTYILDKHLNPVPIGVLGELYIGGEGVARGYINNPELTAQRFIESPFCPGERLYRTGDVTRYFPLGEVEFLGRSDSQIKIRGYRVELGEIEEHIKRIEGVGMCAVNAFTDASGRKSLCAYISGERVPAVSEIKAALTRDLPSYMVPSHYMFMDSLPLNNSAKIDRARLPMPQAPGTGECEEQYISDTERKIAAIWSETLLVPRIGRNESFFDLGGDSLSIVQCVSMIKHRLGAEVSLEELYRNPTLAQCALLADRSGSSADAAIAPAPRRRLYPASSAQKRMYAIYRSQPSSLAYNMPMLFRLEDDTDANRLERSFARIIKRHEAFRTALAEKDGEIVQKILPKADFRLERLSCPAVSLKKTVRELVEPFDLAEPPLIRAAFIEADKKYLFVDMHHSAGDMHTARLLFSELGTLYAGGILPEVRLQYKDYAVWQAGRLKSPELLKQGHFWSGHLSGELPVLNLPSSKRKGSGQSFAGGEVRFSVKSGCADSLRDTARAYGATVFMLMYAAYSILLSKYTGAEDVVIAVPHHGRGRSELGGIAGMFVGTLPIRSRPEGGITAGEFLDAVRESCSKAFAASDYPLEEMLSGLKLTRDPSRNPLFDTMLVYQTGTEDAISCEGLPLRRVKLPSFTSKMDLVLEVAETRGGFDCRFEYDSSVCDRAAVGRMAKSFSLLLETLPEKMGSRLSDVGVLPPEEYGMLVRDFSGPAGPADGDVVGVFEAVAKKYADKTALHACDGSLTFSELNGRSNALAAALRQAGVKPGDVVVLALRRSSGLIISMLGVLKAGGAYLPVDLAYPYDRIAFMLSDSGAKAAILDSASEGRDIHFTGKRLYLDEMGGIQGNLPSVSGPDDPSYVIYTSGSTGVPKGVVLTRGGLYNLYEGSREPVGYGPELTAVSVTTASFDIFIAETLLPLLNGGTVVLCDEEQARLPHLTARLIEKYCATLLQSTPSRLSAMLADREFRRAAAGLRVIIGGGEKWTGGLVRALRRCTRARLVNGYAPSETTVYSTFSEIRDADRITIGRPIQNTSFYILDKYARPVPVGVPGEAYIGGAGVGIGYINRFELTDERFLPDPFAGGRMYRTGDICSFTSDGEIVIHGRSDDQIKLHGLRIEPGEIEQCMKKFPGVAEAVVKYFPDGGGFLCGFYTGSAEGDRLREYMSERLPLYMVPSRLARIVAFPVTGSGKINRNALKAQDGGVPRKREPMNSAQRALARIWTRVLGTRVSSLDDSFFGLGGDSLSVIKAQAAMYACGMCVSTRDFYSLRTLGAIAAAASGASAHEDTREPGEKATVADSPLAPVNFGRVLLTGATGYAGAHILAELISAYGSRVICLVRGKDRKSAENALRDSLSFYFGDEAEKYMNSVTVLKGDISLPGLGLRGVGVSGVGCVVHSAALTSHAGFAHDFESANVDGTSNVAAFCLKHKLPLLHISTMSVAGTRYAGGKAERGVFDESCYYIGQDYSSSDYVRSKFLAEGIVLDAVRQGLDARIFRAGNLTGRYSDGAFQKHPEKNAFANRLKAIYKLRAVPESVWEGSVEMTPVDLFCRAMLSIAARGGERALIYHLANPYTASIKDISSAMQRLGCGVEALPDQAFLKKARYMSRTGTGAEAASLLKELAEEGGERQITADMSQTLRILERCAFSWDIPDAEYIDAFLSGLLRPAAGEQGTRQSARKRTPVKRES